MLRRLLVTATCLAPAALAGPALAATTVSLADALAATCPEPTTQAFIAWGDAGWYAQTPGGGFEAKSSKWSFTGGAARVAATKPFSLSPAASAYALAIPAGGSATTAPFCTTLSSPTVRFATRLASAASAPALRIEVLWTSPLTGADMSAVVGRIDAKGDWAPSPIVPLWANIAALGTKSGRIDLRLRLVAEQGSFQIDDVLVDPYRRV